MKTASRAPSKTLFHVVVGFSAVAVATAAFATANVKLHRQHTPANVPAATASGQPSDTPSVKRTRGILFYVATWTRNPPTIYYQIAGATKMELPSKLGSQKYPAQWRSGAITPVPGVQYFMSVGDVNTDSGIIQCWFEVDGAIVNKSEPRNTSEDHGAIRCRYP